MSAVAYEASAARCSAPRVGNFGAVAAGAERLDEAEALRAALALTPAEVDSDGVAQLPSSTKRGDVALAVVVADELPAAAAGGAEPTPPDAPPGWARV